MEHSRVEFSGWNEACCGEANSQESWVRCNGFKVMETDIESQFHIKVGRAYRNITAEKSFVRTTVAARNTICLQTVSFDWDCIDSSCGQNCESHWCWPSMCVGPVRPQRSIWYYRSWYFVWCVGQEIWSSGWCDELDSFILQGKNTDDLHG